MSKVTSKLQVTIPKAIADQYDIRPGGEIEWLPAGDAIRVIPRYGRGPALRLSAEERLRLFDEATQRQRTRQRRRPKAKGAKSRGWRREDLYDRACPR